MPKTSVSVAHFDGAAQPERASTGLEPGALATVLLARAAAIATSLEEMSASVDALESAADVMVDVLRKGGKILVAGNGGSAAEAQHFAAELVGRFKRERDPLPVVSLATDPSVVTALANDYGYADVFARQVQALGAEGDLLLLFSTSGQSPNLVRAAQAAKRHGLVVVAVTGAGTSKLAATADFVVPAAAWQTDTIQELHMVVTHVLCDVIESSFAGSSLPPPG